MYTVYKIQNLRNGKCYIGVTKNYKQRVKQHLYKAKRGANKRLYQAMFNEGIENFKFTIIRSDIRSKISALILETRLIFYLDTIGDNGYNKSENEKTLKKLGYSVNKDGVVTILKEFKRN